jgi:hypothetical protein
MPTCSLSGKLKPVHIKMLCTSFKASLATSKLSASATSFTPGVPVKPGQSRHKKPSSPTPLTGPSNNQHIALSCAPRPSVGPSKSQHTAPLARAPPTRPSNLRNTGPYIRTHTITGRQFGFKLTIVPQDINPQAKPTRKVTTTAAPPTPPPGTYRPVDTPIIVETSTNSGPARGGKRGKKTFLDWTA